ncbi:MAG: hypothetical protein IH936_15270 [Acidobacteria bacterium]|nr:hypothetical protein [Acidobacteriota bacterium]
MTRATSTRTRFAGISSSTNTHRALVGDLAETFGLIVVPEILDVWRLAGAGVENVAALMGETMSDRQEALIASFAGSAQRVALAFPAGRRRDEFVARLANQVFVRAMELSEFLA